MTNKLVKCLDCFQRVPLDQIAFRRGYDAVTGENVWPVCIFCEPTGAGMTRRLQAKVEAVHQARKPREIV